MRELLLQIKLWLLALWSREQEEEELEDSLNILTEEEEEEKAENILIFSTVAIFDENSEMERRREKMSRERKSVNLISTLSIRR